MSEEKEFKPLLQRANEWAERAKTKGDHKRIRNLLGLVVVLILMLAAVLESNADYFLLAIILPIIAGVFQALQSKLTTKEEKIAYAARSILAYQKRVERHGEVPMKQWHYLAGFTAVASFCIFLYGAIQDNTVVWVQGALFFALAVVLAAYTTKPNIDKALEKLEAE